MSDTAGPDSSDDIGLAAEYVLGLLDAAERRAVDARLSAGDGALGRLVFAWTEYLAGMAEAEVRPVEPRPALRRAIEARIFGSGRFDWARRLGVLPALIGAAAAALILFAAVNLGILDSGTPDLVPAYQAELQSEDGELVILAAFDPEGGRLAVNRQSGAAAPDRALQLWLIPPDAAPISLGVMPDESIAQFDLPAELADRVEGSTLAVSDEPAGGSPTGQPTGAVLAATEITSI